MAAPTPNTLERTTCSEPHPCEGVNLGGWLVLERWLVSTFPDNPYEGTDETLVPDTYTLMEHLRKTNQLAKLDRWYDTFVTKASLERLKADGVRSIRLPFGYWNVDASLYPDAPGFYAGTPFKQMDALVGWAEELEMTVLLDLHGAPGQQSGEQTTGRQSGVSGYEWSSALFDADATLRCIQLVCERYHSREFTDGSPVVAGVELLNEPELPMKVLQPFYKRAYAAVRAAGMAAARVAVVINPYTPTDQAVTGCCLNARMPWPLYRNVVLDWHNYYAFGPCGGDADYRIQLISDLFVPLQTFSKLVLSCGKPMVFGEWSLATGSKIRYPSSPVGFNLAMRDFGHSLLRNQQRYEITSRCCGLLAPRRRGLAGSYFWTWAHRARPAPGERNPAVKINGWSLLYDVNEGWLPRGAALSKLASVRPPLDQRRVA